jgi:hypothetical protein
VELLEEELLRLDEELDELVELEELLELDELLELEDSGAMTVAPSVFENSCSSFPKEGNKTLLSLQQLSAIFSRCEAMCLLARLSVSPFHTNTPHDTALIRSTNRYPSDSLGR